MAKKTIIDLKKTSNTVAPDSNYVRLKTNPDNSLGVIYSDGRTRTITHAWELPIENKTISDPSTLTPNSWDRYIIPTLPAPVGDWSGHEEEIATWNDIHGTWEFTMPEQGWGAYNKAENQIYTFNGVIWSKLNASVTIIDVTHAELRLLIRGSSLIPGNLYRITDYQSFNEIITDSDIMHTSSTSMLLAEAISSNQLKGDVTDLSNINDAIIYDPSITAKGNFYQYVDKATGTINDDDASFDDDYMWDYNLAPYFEVNFISDTELSLGLDTIIDPNTTFSIGDNGSMTYVTLNDPNVNWDYTTGILTLSGAYTFLSNASTYYIAITANFACSELMKGRIIQRHDLVNNIDCDYDWRNHKYGLYRAVIDFYNGGNSFYCSPSRFEIVVQEPRLDQSWGNTSRSVLSNIDTNDYMLFPSIQSVGNNHKNIKIRNSKHIILEEGIIDGLEILSSDGVYFDNHSSYDSKITGAYRAVALPNGYLKDSSITRLTSSILTAIIRSANLEIDRCLLGRVSYSDLSLTHIIMNGTSRLAKVSGDIGTVELNDNTDIYNSKLLMNNVIAQNGTTIYNSTIGDGNAITQVMMDNFKLTDSLISLPSGHQISYVYFENKDISDLTWKGYMEGSTGIGNQVYFPLIDTSNIKGEMVEEVFPGMEIHNNTIYHNADFTLPPININIDADVSTSPITLELPPEPYNGLIYTFTDVTGNAALNNITVSISSAPAVGIINSINGDINKVINDNYGVLIIKYTDVGGWIIIQESVVQVNADVDDITIEKSAIPPYEFSNGMDITELVQNNWFNNIDNWGTGGEIGTTYTDPVLTLAVGEDTILDSLDATYNVWDAGIYRFYSDIDLVADGQVAFWADNLGSGIYFTSSWDAVEGKFLHEATLVGTEEIYGLYCDNAITATANIYLVNRYTYTGIIEDPSITIKGIRRIIDDDYESIDGSNTPMSDAHRELVTRAFFNANVQIIPVTYLELKTMYDAGTMSAGAFYRITDYQHNNWLDPDYSGINTSPNHPIVVYASKNDSLSWIALDDNYKDDTIIYHIDDKADVSIGLSSFGPHVDDNSTGESYVGYPNVVDSLQDDYHWEIGTAFEITGPIQIKINGSIPLGAINTWDPVTGVITSSEDLVTGRNWNIQLIADIKYKDPTKVKGQIIYRKDNNRNIVGNIDWRLTNYNRWAIDSSVLPTVFTDVVILASNSNVDVGQFHDGTSLSLTPKGSSIIQPMLREHSGNANISFRNCEYVVLNDDSDMTDIELQNVSNFTVPEEGGIGKVSVYNAINYFPIGGFSFIQHKSNIISNGVLFTSNTADCTFNNKIEQQTFPRLTNWIVKGSMRNIGFASIISNNVTINGGQYWADCTYGGYFENNNITAGRISSTDIAGDFRGNNVVMGGLFQQADCAGDFSYNNINCSEFWDVTTTDFNNNIVTATMRYVNLGDVNDTEIKNPIVGLMATHITELDNISFNAISSNSAKVLTKLPLTYALDSTGGVFNLELPPNPTENLTLTFLDVQGNCAINNVIIDVSSTPDVGIVNTINGNTSYSIGTNYAFFQIRYNTIGGWVIMTESQSTVSPDDVTIEKNGSNLFTVKGINFIIDNDNESIDGSNTVSIDDHAELVTKAYVDDNILLNTVTVTLTATDITNKYIDLGVPLSDIISFIVHHAPPQADGVDYNIDIIDTRITWNGLGLDGQLLASDIITIKYR